MLVGIEDCEMGIGLVVTMMLMMMMIFAFNLDGCFGLELSG